MEGDSDVDMEDGVWDPAAFLFTPTAMPHTAYALPPHM